jgi:class 3 adenylate cyclase
MGSEELKRELTTILSADVKGYSRLLGEDKEGPLRSLNVYQELIGGLLQRYQGRMVRSAGDSLLGEFASAVDAVQCGIAIHGWLHLRRIHTVLSTQGACARTCIHVWDDTQAVRALG